MWKWSTQSGSSCTRWMREGTSCGTKGDLRIKDTFRLKELNLMRHSPWLLDLSLFGSLKEKWLSATNMPKNQSQIPLWIFFFRCFDYLWLIFFAIQSWIIKTLPEKFADFGASYPRLNFQSRISPCRKYFIKILTECYLDIISILD